MSDERIVDVGLVIMTMLPLGLAHKGKRRAAVLRYLSSDNEYSLTLRAECRSHENRLNALAEAAAAESNEARLEILCSKGIFQLNHSNIAVRGPHYENYRLTLDYDYFLQIFGSKERFKFVTKNEVSSIIKTGAHQFEEQARRPNAIVMRSDEARAVTLAFKSLFP